MPPDVMFRPPVAADLPAIQALQWRAFSPGRFARTAYRVREGTPALTPFCRIVERDGRLIASVRMTALTIGGRPGALLLGPLAVEPEFAGQGYGRALVADALDHARATGIELVLLVGDEAYYGRFGFVPVPPGQITLPGPADPRRILAAELRPGGLECHHGVMAAA